MEQKKVKQKSAKQSAAEKYADSPYLKKLTVSLNQQKTPVKSKGGVSPLKGQKEYDTVPSVIKKSELKRQPIDTTPLKMSTLKFMLTRDTVSKIMDFLPAVDRIRQIQVSKVFYKAVEANIQSNLEKEHSIQAQLEPIAKTLKKQYPKCYDGSYEKVTSKTFQLELENFVKLPKEKPKKDISEAKVAFAVILFFLDLSDRFVNLKTEINQQCLSDIKVEGDWPQMEEFIPKIQEAIQSQKWKKLDPEKAKKWKEFDPAPSKSLMLDYNCAFKLIDWLLSGALPLLEFEEEQKEHNNPTFKLTISKEELKCLQMIVKLKGQNKLFTLDKIKDTKKPTQAVVKKNVQLTKK